MKARSALIKSAAKIPYLQKYRCHLFNNYKMEITENKGNVICILFVNSLEQNLVFMVRYEQCFFCSLINCNVKHIDIRYNIHGNMTGCADDNCSALLLT